MRDKNYCPDCDQFNDPLATPSHKRFCPRVDREAALIQRVTELEKQLIIMQKALKEFATGMILETIKELTERFDAN